MDPACSFYFGWYAGMMSYPVQCGRLRTDVKTRARSIGPRGPKIVVTSFIPSFAQQVAMFGRAWIVF